MTLIGRLTNRLWAAVSLTQAEVERTERVADKLGPLGGYVLVSGEMACWTGPISDLPQEVRDLCARQDKLVLDQRLELPQTGVCLMVTHRSGIYWKVMSAEDAKRGADRWLLTPLFLWGSLKHKHTTS